jgi:hypothetical protein
LQTEGVVGPFVEAKCAIVVAMRRILIQSVGDKGVSPHAQDYVGKRYRF